jgi:GNAT superfamily N-acetyltransferase
MHGVIDQRGTLDGKAVNAAPKPELVFAEEEFTPELVEEGTPLMVAHWDEVNPNDKYDINPDWYQYFMLYEEGMLKVFTARYGDELIGYMTWFVSPSLHKAGVMVANEDALFVKKDRRGMMAGMKLIKFAEQTFLETTEVRTFVLRVKTTHDFGKYLERLGYSLKEMIYTKES